MKCVERQLKMMSCVGYGISRRVGFGKFATNSPASTWDLVRSLYRRRTHVRGVVSHTRGRQRDAATLQTAYSKCMQGHPQQPVVALGAAPNFWRHNQTESALAILSRCNIGESLLDSEWNARLTCSCFNMLFPVYPCIVTGICLLDPVGFGFCSVWALDGVLIRSSQARDSIRPQNAYLQRMIRASTSSGCRKPVSYDTLYKKTSIFQSQRIIYISTQNLAG